METFMIWPLDYTFVEFFFPEDEIKPVLDYAFGCDLCPADKPGNIATAIAVVMTYGNRDPRNSVGVCGDCLVQQPWRDLVLTW